MKNPNTTTLFRGDILRVKSVSNDASQKHVNEDYRLVRTLGARDKNLIGDETGPMRFVYNLVNTKTGKARVTDADRQFVTTADGVHTGVSRAALEQHFGMTFRVATDEATIAPAVKRAVDAEVAKQPVMQSRGLAHALASLLQSGFQMIPVIGPNGDVLAYAAQ